MLKHSKYGVHVAESPGNNKGILLVADTKQRNTDNQVVNKGYHGENYSKSIRSNHGPSGN